MKNHHLLTVALMLATTTSQAAFNIYTDQALWATNATATGNVLITEDFTDSTLNCSLTAVSDNGTVNGGHWVDIVDNDPRKTTDFNWDVPVFAVGGDWDLANPGGPGTGIALTAVIHSGGSEYIYEIPPTTTGFVGFTGDQPIDKLEIRAGTQSGVQETYYLDNLQYTEVASVLLDHDTCGVENHLITGDPQNCTVQDRVQMASKTCTGEAINHGNYVSCFTSAMNELKKATTISGAEKGALTSCAARSSIAKPITDR
ncbi:MAG: hypothetical protein RLZ25_1434 [Pseudomonadota bacterium]|jgi:hypothetical protein